ncbi:MAG: hypothetical protein OEW77_08245 [Gemmatimonadota bacterium]|nr:hypothetical protein [Gemmatimonadota bacterium]
MRYSIGSILVAGALIASAGAATAQARMRPATAGVSGGIAMCCLSRLSEAEAAEIDARIEDAALLAQEGKLEEARKALKSVIADQQKVDAYANRSLRELAGVLLALDRPLEAAATLKQLAWQAAQADDPETELMASVDAAVTYAQFGKHARAGALIPRIRQLLDSPRIPEETRRMVASQIVW